MALTKIPANLLSGVDLGDSVRVNIGSDNDLALFHTGINGVIHNTTGELRIRANNLKLQDYTNEHPMIVATKDGSVDLYHDNQKKFETSSTGATVTGNLAVTGDLDITGNVNSASVTDLDVTDKTITLGVGQTEAQSGGSGIVIDGSNASMLWNESNTRFDFNASINTTGSIRTAGAIVSISNTATQIKNATDEDVQHKFETNSSSDYALQRLIGSDGLDNKFIIGYGPNHGSTPQHLALKNTHATGSIGFNTGASSIERLRIDSSGNVGIGETSPDGELHVKGTGGGNGDIYVERTSGAKIHLQAQSANGKIGTISNHNLGLNTNATTRVTIETGGNVGIGTTNPSTLLHLGGTAPGDSIIRQDSTSSGTNWEIGERAAGKWQIFEDDGDKIVTTFKSDGNVGIGTTSPNSYSGQTALTINSTGVARLDLDISDARQGYLLAESGYAGLFADSGKSLRFGVGTEAIRIKSNNRVGINDGDPPSVLTVLGTNSAFVTSNGAGINGIQVTRTTSSGENIYLYTGDGNATGWSGSGNVGRIESYGNNAFEIGTQQNASISFGTSNTERLRIHGDGQVTKPYQSGFYAVKSNAQTISVNQSVIFNTTTENVGGDYNTSTGIYTAPYSGFYLFAYTILLGPSLVNDIDIDHYLGTSNRNYIGGMPGRTRYQTSGTTGWGDGYLGLGHTQIAYMDAGDTANVYFSHLYTTGNVSVPVYANTGNNWTKFYGYFLG